MFRGLIDTLRAGLSQRTDQTRTTADHSSGAYGAEFTRTRPPQLPVKDGLTRSMRLVAFADIKRLLAASP